MKYIYASELNMNKLETVCYLKYIVWVHKWMNVRS
jgi:hypothetical protein